MFGDIQDNNKDWTERCLGEICEKIIRYPTFYGMDYIESGTRVIRIGNILNDGHMETNNDNYVFVYDGVNVDFPETVIEENDIVMAVRGDPFQCSCLENPHGQRSLAGYSPWDRKELDTSE